MGETEPNHLFMQFGQWHKENKTVIRQLDQVSEHSFHFAFQNRASCAELKDTAEKRKWKCWSFCLVRLLQLHGLVCPWDSPGKNTGGGCHFLLQGIFPTQGSKPGLLHCDQFSTIWATWEAHRERREGSRILRLENYEQPHRNWKGGQLSLL